MGTEIWNIASGLDNLDEQMVQKTMDFPINYISFDETSINKF